MFELPPIPTWDALHPLVIHFPIVLTMIAPVLVALAIPNWRHRWPLAFTAMGIMIVGSIFAWVAVSTGESAGELAIRSAQINPVLETHEELAEFTAAWLTGLAVGITLLIVAAIAWKRHPQWLWIGGCVILLGCQLVGILAVANTAHNGGRLVHEFGVHALLPAEPLPNAASYKPIHMDDDDD